MDISFSFEIVGDFRSEDLWEELACMRVNLVDTIDRIFVYGVATPSALVKIIIICGYYGVIKGGEFICE